MPNNVNREMYNLDVQSITESPENGVLATIGGKFSTSSEPSRNDRTYTPELWRSVVESDRVKEMLETKTFYGELSHPPRPAEFLSEVQMANVSHNITKLEFDEGTKDLIGTIDILDTPSGKIAHTLLKYGSKLGISSRGIVMDDGRYNSGNSNEMNPDNYYLVTFDLVALPGIMGARLNQVAAESAMGPSKLVLESLNDLKEKIKKAKQNNDKESVKVLEALAKEIKSEKEMKEDQEVQSAIKDLSKREETKQDQGEVSTDDDILKDDEEVAAVLEKTEDDNDMEKEEANEALKGDDRLSRFWTDKALQKKVLRDYIKEFGKEDVDNLKASGDWDDVFDGYFMKNVDKYMPKEVEKANEDDSGATQASDIAGPKSTINVIGSPLDKGGKLKVQTFLESFENINTVEDVEKYVQSLEGVEKDKDGRVIINKDTVLFNTMLSMINSLRLKSDANPLAKPGVNIKDTKDLDKEYVGTEPENKEYDQEETDPEVIKKSIKDEGNPHNASLESALAIIKSSSRKVEKLEAKLEEHKAIIVGIQKENEVLKSKLKSNYISHSESIMKKDNIIKELSAKVAEADRLKKKAATEAATSMNSYRALETVNLQLKTNLQSTEKELKILKDKYDIVTGRKAEDAKDRKIRKLLEAQSISVESVQDDEDAIRTANEIANESLSMDSSLSEAERRAKLLERFVTKKK